MSEAEKRIIEWQRGVNDYMQARAELTKACAKLVLRGEG